LDNSQLASLLATNSGGTKTAAQLLATIDANGGSLAGRAAAVREAAMEPAVSALLDSSGMRVNGLVLLNEAPGFGVLFELLPG
jgi:hypothetical protein